MCSSDLIVDRLRLFDFDEMEQILFKYQDI